jgi:hypothetical protein
MENVQLSWDDSEGYLQVVVISYPVAPTLESGRKLYPGRHREAKMHSYGLDDFRHCVNGKFLSKK